MSIESQGSVISVSDGGDPESFLEVGEITGWNGPDGTANVLDASHLKSTMREKKMGLADEGQISLDVLYQPGDAGQEECKTIRKSRTLRGFKIELADDNNTVEQFDGYVLQFSRQGAVDELVRGTLVIEISGEVTEPS